MTWLQQLIASRSPVESILGDVRLACRSIRRSPALSVIAVLTLALGIGVNTTIFSIINAMILRPLPVASPERLVWVSTRNAIQQGFLGGWSYALWDQLRQQDDLFEAAVAWTVLPQRLDLSRRGERQPVDGVFVSGNFFQALGIPLHQGGGFGPGDDRLGSPASHVAVLSDAFWRRHFQGATAVGKTLVVNQIPVTIVGIAPPQFLGPEVGRTFDIALPIGAAPTVLHQPNWGGPSGRSYVAVMFRLRDGQSPVAIASALRARQRRLVEAAMPPRSYWGEVQDSQMKDPFEVAPASAGFSELRRQYAQSLATLFVIAGLVLLIACVNVANLLLARTTAEQHEFGVRLALGASRRRVVQQQLTASLLLGLAGAAAGFVLATWCTRVLVAQLSTWTDRVALDVSPDWRLLAFTAATCVATSVLFGIIPAMRASRVRPGALMNTAAVTNTPGRGARVRDALIFAQVVLALVLLIASTLLVRSFQQLGTVPLGFDSDRLLAVRLDTTRTSIGSETRTALIARLVDAARAVPGVANAAVSLNTPLDRGITPVSDFTARNGAELPPAEQRVILNLVTPGWFETYGAVVTAGRTIAARDTAGAPSVVVVNDAFARKFFPRGNALGSTIVNVTLGQAGEAPSSTIVGIVANVVGQSLRSEPFPVVYQPFAQFSIPFPIFEFSLSIRASTMPPDRLAPSLAAALSSVEPDLAFSFRTLSDQVAAATHQERMVAWLAGGFGALALALATIGLYGVTWYAVTRRRSEIGLRMALGAQRRDVVGLTLRSTMMVIVLGAAAGALLAAGATRYLQGELFGVTPLDPVTFVSVPLALVLVAFVACYLPARRAASINPMDTLRCD